MHMWLYAPQFGFMYLYVYMCLDILHEFKYTLIYYDVMSGTVLIPRAILLLLANDNSRAMKAENTTGVETRYGEMDWRKDRDRRVRRGGEWRGKKAR